MYQNEIPIGNLTSKHSKRCWCMIVPLTIKNISRGELYYILAQTPRRTSPTLSTVYKWQSYSITSKERKFNAVSTDMALEQTLNKDTKTNQGGIVGFTQNYDAVEKWTLTSHLRATVYNNFIELVKHSESNQEKQLSIATVAKKRKVCWNHSSNGEGTIHFSFPVII